MKKLAIIGIVVAGLAGLIVPVAAGGTDIGIGIPAGRDVVYSGPPVKGENYFARGLPKATVHQAYSVDVPVKGENYFARGLPSSVASNPAPSSSTGFQWGNVGIGASGALALLALAGVGTLGLRRHRGHLRTS